MSVVRPGSLFFLLTLAIAAPAQKLKKSDKEVIANLQKHVGFLADDRLEGRRAGSPGERLAMEYIADRFQDLGLQPKGSQGFFQPFQINEGLTLSDSCLLVIDGDSLAPYTDYFPFPFSAQERLEAEPAIAIQEMDMPWFVNLQEILEDNRTNPHFDLPAYIYKNAEKARGKGASAVIIFNTGTTDDQLKFDPRDRSVALGIPVIYVGAAASKKYFSDPTASMKILMNIRIVEKLRTGHNVVAMIDNGAPNTVVLGAHYDHLGYGEDGNSLFRTGEKQIHNGADDNASGTAALIELARMLKNRKEKKSNYLFIAFSGEELGLYGSKYFTEHPAIDLKTVSYMVNMDMIGRLNDSSHALTIGGYGTSPSWASVIRTGQKNSPFRITLDSSGSGPSDHTSFYRKDIPVLFFFTNAHADYHRPTDDADKINYTGEFRILQYIDDLIGQMSSVKPEFRKTRESQVSVASFKVTLGIMPDYTFSGAGVRADGVSEGRPAAKAGLQTGDVITQLGEYPVHSMETYMQALNKFSKGQTTTIQFSRGREKKQAALTF